MVSAASAAEALEALAAAEAPPAAGIVDVSLRPSGARGAVEALRAEGLDFGVVWIGGEAPMPEDQAYLDAIGGRFVPKPFAPAALFEALHAVAPAPRSAERLIGERRRRGRRALRPGLCVPAGARGRRRRAARAGGQPGRPHPDRASRRRDARARRTLRGGRRAAPACTRPRGGPRGVARGSPAPGRRGPPRRSLRRARSARARLAGRGPAGRGVAAAAAAHRHRAVAQSRVPRSPTPGRRGGPRYDGSCELAHRPRR